MYFYNALGEIVENANEFPCYLCANKEKDHPDHCEFAWDEYNRHTTKWDCLGAK